MPVSCVLPVGPDGHVVLCNFGLFELELDSGQPIYEESLRKFNQQFGIYTYPEHWVSRFYMTGIDDLSSQVAPHRYYYKLNLDTQRIRQAARFGGLYDPLDLPSQVSLRLRWAIPLILDEDVLPTYIVDRRAHEREV